MSINSKRSVPSHQEVAPGRGYERGHQSHQVVVHVPRVPQGSGGGRHHGADQGVGLAEAGIRYFQPVHRNVVECRVVEDHHAVRVEGKSLESQQGVVGLHHHVAVQLLVGEDRVGLDELLGELVVQLLEQVGAHAGACAARDRVQEHEALQGVAAFRLPLDHVHDLLLHCFCLAVARGPVIACATAFFAYEDVLRVVERGEVRGLDTVDHTRLQVDQQSTRDVVLVVRLVEKHVFAAVP